MLGWMNACHFLGGNRDACGYVASALVLATFSMKSMRPLRITAIASNIAFLLYALNMHLQPIFILHGILLPLNIFRLVQIESARAAHKAGGESLIKSGAVAGQVRGQQLGDAVHRRPALEERLGIF